jgi:hypothetical protein
MSESDLRRTIGTAVVGDDDFPTNPHFLQGLHRLGHAAADGPSLVQAGHDNGKFNFLDARARDVLQGLEKC